MFLFLILNLLAIVVFIYFPKKLSKLEIAGCWLVDSLLHEDFLTILIVNLEIVKPIKGLMSSLVITSNRLILFPILSILLIELVMRTSYLFKKILFFIVFVGFLIIQQFFIVKLGIERYPNFVWRIFFISAVVEGFFMIFIGFVFKKILKGEKVR